MLKNIALVTAATFLFTLSGSAAADVKVLTAGAFKSVALTVVPEVEKQTGQKIILENDTAGALMKRVTAGEAFDVVILTPALLQQLGEAGKVAPDSIARLAKVSIGVMVRKGAPQPDVGTVEKFKAALLSAKSVAYIDPAAGGSSGIYLSKLFEKLGIADQVKAKAVLVQGGLVAEPVARGEAEIGLHQISEIVTVPGAQLVAPLPAEIQNVTVYAGALSQKPADRAAAQAFLDALRRVAASGALAAKGMEAP